MQLQSMLPTIKSVGQIMFSILLRKEETLNLKRSEKVAEISAKIEFSNNISDFLSQGQVFSMSKIHELYIKIRSRCNVKIPEVSRKTGGGGGWEPGNGEGIASVGISQKNFTKDVSSMSLRVLLLILRLMTGIQKRIITYHSKVRITSIKQQL